jgi:hypothetical protein
MAQLPATVTACIDQALAQAPSLLGAALDKVAQTLDETAAARRGDWRAIEDAARELRAVRNTCTGKIGKAWRAAMQGEDASSSNFGSLDALSLVDDDQLVKSVESARLAQELVGKVEQALSELDSLMSAALGLKGIEPGENPLRPELLARATRTVLGESATQPQSPALWMRHLAPVLAPELAEIYRAASKRLQSGGVQPAGYRLITTPGSPAAARPAAKGQDQEQPAGSQGQGQGSGHGQGQGQGQGAWGGGSAGAEGASGAPGGGHPQGSMPSLGAPPEGGTGFVGWMGRAVQALRGPLMRDFLGGSAAGRLPTSRALDPSWYQWVDQQAAELDAQPEEPSGPPPERVHTPRNVAPADRPVRSVGTDSALDGDSWGRFAAARERAKLRLQLLREARQVGQVMGLQVVRQLLDEVARDPRLLAPVREAIVAVEPALARLAMHAPEFFGQKEHPARHLLEAVAERSLHFNDEQDRAFAAFMEPVRDSFKALNALDRVPDDSPFAEQLAKLKASWAMQDEQEAAKRKRLLEAMEFAERRQAEATRIAQDLSQRSDLDGVPPLLQEFLFERWSLVLAHARLTHAGTHLDPGGYLSVVADLLWSVKSDIALREPTRAFEVLPRILTKLRDGLQLLGQTPADAHAFFAALEQLHRPILDLRAKLRKQTLPPAAPVMMPAEKLKPAAPQKPVAPEGVWLAPRDLKVCGFEEADAGDRTLPFHRPPPQPVAPANLPDPESFVSQLQEGSWVDIFSMGRWRRVRVTWTGTRGALFMFVGEGGEPVSMTRRTLLRLVEEHLVRAVDTQDAVQRAIDAIASAEPQPAAA